MASAKQFTVFTKFAVKNGASGPMLNIAKGADKLAMSLDTARARSKSINQAFGTVAKWGAVAAAGAVFVGKSFSDAGAQVENYKATLKVMLGSQEAANARFEEMSKFAAATPFELNDVVELGNKLQSLGKYSLENMTILGDLAAAAGKPIDQVSSAFAKLASGQKGVAIDMFRDLLITTDDWSKATGKAVNKNGELMATTAEMMEALPKIMKSKNFSGMMEAQSKTFGGMASNLADSVSRLNQSFGESLNESLKKVMPLIQGFIESISDWAVKNADKIEAFFDGFFNGVKKVLGVTGPILKGLYDFAMLLKPIAPLIIGIVAAIGAYVAITKAMAATSIVLTAVQTALNLAMSANPIGLITIAIAALIGIIALLIASWDTIGPTVMATCDIIKKAILSVVAIAFLPMLVAIDAILSGLIAVGKMAGMDVSGLQGFQDSARNFVKDNTFAGDAMKMIPMNPQTTSSSTKTTNSNLSVSFANAPAGTKFTQDKPAPGISVKTGAVRGGGNY